MRGDVQYKHECCVHDVCSVQVLHEFGGGMLRSCVCCAHVHVLPPVSRTTRQHYSRHVNLPRCALPHHTHTSSSSLRHTCRTYHAGTAQHRATVQPHPPHKSTTTHTATHTAIHSWLHTHTHSRYLIMSARERPSSSAGERHAEEPPPAGALPMQRTTSSTGTRMGHGLCISCA